MNDINRILVFVILIGLLYALYKYQHVIFDTPQEKVKKIQYKRGEKRKITSDNISQISLKSLSEGSSEGSISRLLSNDSGDPNSLGSLLD